MKYKIEQENHEYNGRNYTDIVLTFANGKKWKLVPLTRKGSVAGMSYFYALLNDEAM